MCCWPSGIVYCARSSFLPKMLDTPSITLTTIVPHMLHLIFIWIANHASLFINVWCVSLVSALWTLLVTTVLSTTIPWEIYTDGYAYSASSCYGCAALLFSHSKFHFASLNCDVLRVKRVKTDMGINSSHRFTKTISTYAESRIKINIGLRFLAFWAWKVHLMQVTLAMKSENITCGDP